MSHMHARTQTPIERSGLFRSSRKVSRKRVLPLAALLMAALWLLAACAPAATTPIALAPTSQPTQALPTAAPTALPPAPTQAAPTAEPTAAPSAAPISLVDGMGRTVTLQGPAQRIISLAPSDTEILFAVGAGSQVVGVDKFSDYPADAKKLPNIGAGFDQPDTERILALKPDLVLAAGIQAPEKVKALSDLGLTVFLVPNPTGFDGLYQNLRTVGQLTGHAADADALVTQLTARVSAVAAKIGQAKSQPLVLYELDGSDPNAPWTTGPGTFVDTIIRLSGGRNVGSVLKSDWAQISTEELVKQSPQVILLGDALYGGMTAALVKQRGGWTSIAAVKEGKIFPFDDNLVSRPGPRMVDGLETMAKLLHPELFTQP